MFTYDCNAGANEAKACLADVDDEDSPINRADGGDAVSIEHVGKHVGKTPQEFVRAYFQRLLRGDTGVVLEYLPQGARMTWVKDGVHSMTREEFIETVDTVFCWNEADDYVADIDVATTRLDDGFAVTISRFREPHGGWMEVVHCLAYLNDDWTIVSSMGRPLSDDASKIAPISACA